MIMSNTCPNDVPRWRLCRSERYRRGSVKSPSKTSSAKGLRLRVDQRVQHESAATRLYLTSRIQPLPPPPRAERPSATLLPRATDKRGHSP